MLAGRLRHKVVIERRVDVRGAGGTVESSYETLYTTLAEINILGGSEAAAAGPQIQATATTKIRIRYKDGIDPTCRVRQILPSPLPAVTFDIVACMPDHTGQRELILWCTQRSAEGFRRGE